MFLKLEEVPAPTAQPIPHTVSGPEHDPADRGECLEVLDASRFPFVRCQGRMRSNLLYIEGGGFLLQWMCSECSKVVVP
jgi:hypothetical protein